MHERERLRSLNLTPRSSRVSDAAAAEARCHGHDFIGTEHLLLGLLAEPDGIAGQVLARLKVDAAARTNLLKIIRAPATWGPQAVGHASARLHPAPGAIVCHPARTTQAPDLRRVTWRMSPRSARPSSACATPAGSMFKNRRCATAQARAARCSSRYLLPAGPDRNPRAAITRSLAALRKASTSCRKRSLCSGSGRP